MNAQFSASSSTGRQYSAISETDVLIQWASGQEDLAVALKQALDRIGNVKKISINEGAAAVSGPTEFLNHAVFVSVFPRPFAVLK